MFENTLPLCLISYTSHVIGLSALDCYAVQPGNWQNVPLAPPLLLGMLDAPGTVIPVIDLPRLLFGSPFPASQTSWALIITPRGDHTQVAFPLLQVPTLVQIALDEFQAEPQGLFAGRCTYEQSLVGILDLPRLLRHVHTQITGPGNKPTPQKR